MRDLGARRGVPSYADFPTAGKGLSPFVPAGQGERAILPNEPVIVDLMWAQDGYLVDMARTYSVGPMDAKMEEAYAHAVAVLRAIEAGIRPGSRGRGPVRRRACSGGLHTLRGEFHGPAGE